MSTDPELLIEQRGQALWLTIQREERRNAINGAVLEALTAALADASRNTAVRAVVLTGAGTRAFCAGADLQSGQSFRFDYSQPHQGLADLFRQARRCTVPLIARVNGACMAGGLGLLAMCDMASRSAMFGLPEVKVGLFPAQVLAVLQHQLPRRVLNELCLTGEPMSANRALAAGLINDVAEPEALDAAVDALLARLLDKSPSAIRRGLYTLKQVEHLSFEQAMAFTESQIGLFALTEDAQEGQAAFREKRAPNWTAR